MSDSNSRVKIERNVFRAFDQLQRLKPGCRHGNAIARRRNLKPKLRTRKKLKVIQKNCRDRHSANRAAAQNPSFCRNVGQRKLISAVQRPQDQSVAVVKPIV